MERLTERCALERWTSRETVEPEEFVMVRGKALGRAYFESDKDYKNYCDALDKLAAYEDTGLEPEECAEYAQAEKEGRYILLKEPRSAGVHRLEEIARADIEGRLAVLPCKVGTVVWSSVLTEIDADGNEHAAPWPFVPGMMDEWGKGFFATKEEAEAALKGVSEDGD